MKTASMIAVAAIVALSSSAAYPTIAEELGAPPVGRVLTYGCTGDYGGDRKYVIRSVEEGIVTYDLTVDGAPGYAIKPIWLTGTGLYREVQTKKGGKLRITSGLESFDGLRSLTVGLVLDGSVLERAASGGSTRWSVTVRVPEERDFQSDAVGSVHVFVVEETWKAQDVTLKGVAYVSPKFSAVIYWRRSLSGGKGDECKLVSLRDP